MKINSKFFKKLFFFTLISFISIECSIRIFKLTNDIPQREIDENGLQTYVVNQTGYFNNNLWKVNEYGFIGLKDVNHDNQILIIGDSMIENIMNPIECNLGYYIKNQMKEKYGVFEIGRSGMTLIEAMEFKKKYETIIKPKKIIVFINENDVEESISEISRLSDRLQISIKSGDLEKVKIKYPILKKILYQIKTIYYLYIKGYFSVNFLDFRTNQKVFKTNNDKLEKFFTILKLNYDLEKITFLVNSNDPNIELIEREFKKDRLIKFETSEDWFVKGDGHWNCLGHKNVSNIIVEKLKNIYSN